MDYTRRWNTTSRRSTSNAATTSKSQALTPNVSHETRIGIGRDVPRLIPPLKNFLTHPYSFDPISPESFIVSWGFVYVSSFPFHHALTFFTLLCSRLEYYWRIVEICTGRLWNGDFANHNAGIPQQIMQFARNPCCKFYRLLPWKGPKTCPEKTELARIWWFWCREVGKSLKKPQNQAQFNVSFDTPKSAFRHSNSALNSTRSSHIFRTF